MPWPSYLPQFCHPNILWYQNKYVSLIAPSPVLGTDLSTILPVNFEPIVFLSIVWCCHHYTSCTLEVQHGEWHKWSWAHLWE